MVTSALIQGIYTAATGFNPVVIAAMLAEIGVGVGLQVINSKTKETEVNKNAYKLISSLG